MNRSSNAPDRERPSNGGEPSKPRGSFQQGSHFNRGDGNRIAPRYSAASQRRSSPRPARSGDYTEASARAYRGTGHRGASKVQGNHVYRGDDPRPGNQPLISEPVIVNHAEGYQTRAPHQKPLKRKSKAPIVLGCIVGALFVAAFGVYLWWANTMINVTVNGAEAEVRRGTTVEQLVDAGYAAPVAGNLLAIDGSLLTEGGGEPFTATVNGNKVNPGYAVADGNAVEVSNGGDLTEESTTEQVAIPHSTTGSSSPEDYYTGAIHTFTEGQDGVKEVTTGTVSGIVQETVVQEPVDAGYQHYDVDTGDEKVVALTFDDGPWPDSSNAILDILKENDAKATFFTIGEQIPEYGEATKRAVSEGHQICTHSYDHASGSGQGVNLTFMTPEEQVQEIQKGYQAIEDATGQEASTVIRAPGGNFYGDLVTNLQPYITAEIGWNIDTEDWSLPGVDAIVSAIESAQPGNVILMHDGGGDRSQTVEALRIALPHLKEQGYRFVTIDELLQYPPTTSDA